MADMSQLLRRITQGPVEQFHQNAKAQQIFSMIQSLTNLGGAGANIAKAATAVPEDEDEKDTPDVPTPEPGPTPATPQNSPPTPQGDQLASSSSKPPPGLVASEFRQAMMRENWERMLARNLLQTPRGGGYG